MSTIAVPDDRSPSLGSFLREAGSVLFLKARRLAAALVADEVAAEGRPVLVIPGLLASDHSTALLRRSLQRAGFRVHGWELGLNLGVRSDLLDRLERQLERTARYEPAAVVGWSLGGLYARELAKRRPELVSRVVTLGSPFSGNMRSNHAWRLYELINDHKVDSPPIAVRLHEKPPVPTVALWSRRDGIVAPACARGREGECDRHVELSCTHMGFVSDPSALRAVAEALA